ncbi:F0F1 ATP synthase subunit A [Paenibacillus sp. TRM 82003]|uniref:F0F1 ATP synthase subunit A n=1 Tax=Kineococcus sp. TRM81007 TaxID=2925831 RepID=UPI001F57AFCB|nr:F0F1 ATP synthase subunit A [Kineococcus sp. TRM81007]MCI2239302.1 F0F1 ATP synthase subunit A [Kineococcus sp. TRM81007]MCI3924986.1 F0F1 ATP synthase subunit A [Paenibacillus sp. TRM 82003]
MSLSTLATAGGESFEAPAPADFWQPLIGDGAFALTRPMVLMALSFVIIAAVLLATTKRLSVVPANKKQFAVEALYGFVRNGVARDIIGSKEFLRYVPLLFTLFTLILVNNVFGVIPPIQYPTMSRIGFPIALTLVVFVLYHLIGMKRKGVGGYFKSLMPAGVPIFLVPVVYLLELFTYFISRPLTLAVRLFANMFAGHMLILVLFLGGEHLLLHGEGLLPAAGVVSYLFGLVMSFFELLIQVLQAYIFVLLTATYIAGSLADEH